MRVKIQNIDDFDYEFIGFVLACHLIIEKHMDELLSSLSSVPDWESARLGFNDKIKLLNHFKVSDKYHCMPGIRRLNQIRNKLSHNLSYSVPMETYEPLKQFLISSESTTNPETIDFNDPKSILKKFTDRVSILFAGATWGTDRKQRILSDWWAANKHDYIDN